jgi:hypothetical protein
MNFLETKRYVFSKNLKLSFFASSRFFKWLPYHFFGEWELEKTICRSFGQFAERWGITRRVVHFKILLSASKKKFLSLFFFLNFFK